MCDTAPHESEHTTLRLPLPLKRRVQRFAFETHRSLNSAARVLFAIALDQIEPDEQQQDGCSDEDLSRAVAWLLSRDHHIIVARDLYRGPQHFRKMEPQDVEHILIKLEKLEWLQRLDKENPNQITPRWVVRLDRGHW
jgi:hypothetical protein